VIVPSQARGVGFGALALVALASLAGCSVYENLFGSKIPPPACPGVSVLADGATLIKFRSGDGRDLTDVLYSGEILGIDATCAYERDRETLVGSVTVELTIDVRAER
jgi:hypothetical protein